MTGDKIFIACLETSTSKAQSLPDSEVSNYIEQGLQLLKNVLYQVKPNSSIMHSPQQLKTCFIDIQASEPNVITVLDNLITDLETAVLMVDELHYLVEKIYKATELFQLAKELLEF